MIDRSQTSQTSQTGSVPERWSFEHCRFAKCEKVAARQKTRRGRIKDRGGRAPVPTPSEKPFQRSDREICTAHRRRRTSLRCLGLAVGKGGARAVPLFLVRLDFVLSLYQLDSPHLQDCR